MPPRSVRRRGGADGRTAAAARRRQGAGNAATAAPACLDFLLALQRLCDGAPRGCYAPLRCRCCSKAPVHANAATRGRRAPLRLCAFAMGACAHTYALFLGIVERRADGDAWLVAARGLLHRHRRR